MNLPEEILTERLRLRPPTEGDAEAMFARYAHDPMVCRYLSWTPHQSVNDTVKYLRQSEIEHTCSPVDRYLIWSRDSSQLLGSVGGAVQDTRVQFGYCLARDAWGHGYATEAARAYVDAVMNDPSIWRIQAYCDTENLASAHVLEKIGLAYEGTLRRFLVMPNLGGDPRDMLIYAKVRE
jgi:[ribosomal protein S5]-alanine N-acetyltransferase